MASFWRTFMEKSTQTGEGGWFTPLPFTTTITYEVVMYAPAERADITPPISTLPLYVLCGKIVPRCFQFMQATGDSGC